MALVNISKEDLHQLKQTQRLLHDLIPELDKAEACGIDCQDYRRIHEEKAEQTNQIIKNYGGTAK